MRKRIKLKSKLYRELNLGWNGELGYDVLSCKCIIMLILFLTLSQTSTILGEIFCKPSDDSTMTAPGESLPNISSANDIPTRD